MSHFEHLQGAEEGARFMLCEAMMRGDVEAARRYAGDVAQIRDEQMTFAEIVAR